MAKERADLDLNIYTDTKDIDDALVRLNKAIKTSDGSVKNLNKGFIKLKAEGKAAGSTIANTFTSMTQRMKAMNLQLRNIQNQFAGSFKALERQAALRGMKTGALSDDKVWYAQIEKLNLQNKQLVDTYSNVANKISLVNTRMNELTGSYARQRAEIAKYHNQMLYGTTEGGKSLAWDARLKKDKIQLKANKEDAVRSGRTTVTAVNDLEQIESLDRRLGVIQLKLMANYKAINMVTGAFRYLLNYTVEYDKELHQLQAIAAVSDTTMLKLKDSIQAVASSTKFTSLEVAQAGTVLAQAGLSARQIETTLPAIAKLATATGTDLATSTDVVTSTLNIYSLQASEAEHVTNALTTAMNESKADIAGFQKAIQYAGNYAAQLGVTYEETAAVISAATQAGVRSRSMLGTGLRAVLAEFLNPTKKLTAQLEKVGLTVSDIDVRSKGLSTVLKTLKESGFGATEAFRGMERRGAAFLASIINQTDFIDTLREHMAGSTAAAEANEIQMNSLSAQLANFKSIAGTAATEGVAPLSKALTALLKGVNTLLSSGASQGGKPSRLGGGIMAALFGAAGTASTVTSIAMIGGAIATMANQIKMLEKAAEAGKTMKLLSFLSSWKGLGIITVLGGIASAAVYAAEKLGVFTSGADKARAAMEEASGDYEAAREKGESLATMYQKLFDQREKLQDQTERDIFLREILTRFPEAAKYVDNLKISFEDLVEVLTKLKAVNAGEQADKAAKEARKSVEENYKLIKKLGEQYFGDVEHTSKRNGLGTYFEGQSLLYNNLVNRMQASGLFGGLNFKTLNENSAFNLSRLPGIHFTDISRDQYVSRRSALALYEQLRGQLNFNTNSASDLLQQYGKLYSSGLSIGGKEGEALMAVIKQLGEEVRDVAKAISANETKVTSELEAIFSNQNAEDQKRLSELSKIAKDTGDVISKQIKETGTDNDETKRSIDYLMEEYRQQRDILESMDVIARNPDGSRKDFKDYSIKELATYRGMQESDIQKMIDYFKQNGITDEEHIKELIAGDQDRNIKLDSIRAYMEVLESAIRRSNLGSVQFDSMFSDLHYNDAIKALKSISTSRDLKQATQAGSKYLTNMAYAKEENLVRSLSSSLNTKQYGEFRRQLRAGNTFQISGDITSKNFDASKAFNQVNASQKILDIYQGVLGQSLDKNSEQYKAIITQTNAFGNAVSTANKELVSFVNKAPKITDSLNIAQTGMESFFHKLNTDIKAIDIAYTNATRSMDQMLAKQQGVITGLERAYGSGSIAVKAEQVRLSDMEKAQLGDRTEALRTKLSGYTKQLEILRSNPEYQKAKELYDQRFAAWKTAQEGGDSKQMIATYRALQDASKGWDKLATKEESLTSKIADLEDEVKKNTEALKTETRERESERANPFGTIASGFGDAARIYMNDAEEQGYGTLRGTAGFMSEGVIKSLDNNLVTLFDNITTKSKTAKESFKEFGRSVIQTIGDIAKQLLAKQIVMSVLGAFMSTTDQSGNTLTKTGSNTYTTDASYTGGGAAAWGLKHALGGYVTGPIKNRDSVPTMLMPGEYVLKKSAVDSLGRDYLDSLNNKSASYMSNYSSEVTEAKSETTETGTQKGSGVVNVYVVGQEQQQQMTPQDVVVTITQDMITGGQTKKLVKSIAMGAI